MNKPLARCLVLTAGCLAALAPAAAQDKDGTTVLHPPRRLPSAARIANAAEVRQQLRLTPGYENLPGVENLKIAILDYGFAGLDGLHPYLPANAVLVEHYDPEFVRRFHLGDPAYRKGFAPLNAHGRTLAQIIWAVTGFSPRGPRFYLLNANGPTMLRRAVRYAIEAKVDLILFSGCFEGGGNGDGRGPIDAAVAEAIAADIIWVNAAGNYGQHVYNGPVQVLADGYLRLGKDPAGTALRFRNLLDENTVTITLTWNDYREQEDAGTDKDLDLYVEDSTGQVLGSSELRQVAGTRPPGPGESRNPRERVVLPDLAAARDRDYRIRVRARHGSFTTDDRLRVLVTSSREMYLDPETGMPKDALVFLDASGKGEIYPPADFPLVLTIGDTSPNCSLGPTMDHRVKPDVFLPDSRALFSNGEVTAGASNAAAYFAGVVALLKASQPGLRTRHLLWWAHHHSGENAPARASTLVGNTVLRELFPQDLARPLRARRVLRYRTDTALATASRTTRSSVLLSPPSSSAAAEPALRPGVPARLWRTPSPSELANLVQQDP